MTDLKNLDVIHLAGLIRREVRPVERDGQPHSVTVASRVFQTDVDDLWSCVTDKERIPRWFLPVEGDLKVGGRYQLKGNAGGTILTCDKPRHLAVTWEMMGFVSWLDVFLAPEGDGARLTLEHTGHAANPHFDQFGPGATGIGWDLSLIGLHLHLNSNGAPVDDAAVNAWSMSDAGKQYIAASKEGWFAADVKSGRAADVARSAADATYAFYTGT